MIAIDYAILAAYMAGTLVLGLFFASRNKTVSDMFSAGGESPWWVSGLSSFMTMFSAGTFVVWGGIAYKHGLVAVSINLCYGIAALSAGYLVAGKWNALGVRTPAEFIELRFGQSAVQFYTWSLMAFRIVTVSVALYSLAVILVAVMPLPPGHLLRDAATGQMSLGLVIVLFGTVILVYTMLGGLWAVLMTDVLQFIILNLSVVFILVMTFLKIGSPSELLVNAPDGFFALTSGGYTYLFLVGWFAIQFFMIGAEWAFAQRFLSVRTPADARKSTYLFGGLYLFSPLLWLAPPMIYRLIDPTANPEQAYILAGQAVLPAGMLGLMVAAMFSATASMVSSQLNVFAGVLTNDFYRRFFHPEAGESRLVFVGRVISGLLGIFIIAFALSVPYLGGAEVVIIALTSLVVVPLLAPTIWGLLSSKIDTHAVWLTVLISAIFGALINYGLVDGGFLTGFSNLSAIQDWVASNPRAGDIVVGVVIPILVLTTVQFLSGEDSPGWQRVVRFKSRAGRHHRPTSSDDSTPALIVAYGLVGCAASIVFMAFFNDDDRIALVVFGSIVFVLAWAIRRSVRKGSALDASSGDSRQA